MGIKDEYAIVGAGQTDVGHLPEYTKREIVTEAARLALKDSGIPRERIEATIRTDMTPGTGYMPDYTDEFCRILRLPVKAHLKVGRGGAMATPAVLDAMKLIDAGVSEYVLVSAGFTRWTRGHDELRRKMSEHAEGPKMGKWGGEFGALHALHLHAMLASRHMHEYGTTNDDLGRISVAQREWANLNPAAYMHGRPIDIEDYHDSPWIVEPYHLLDCCLESDAGAAFVLTSADNVDEADPDPVYVKGIGVGEQVREDWWKNENYIRLPVGTAKETAFAEADITLDDVDFAQFYDCFTGEVLFQIEGYGWAEEGEGGEFLQDDRLGPDGDVPINTSGGLLSSHHLGDMTGLYEAIVQLRHEAGERQVDGADVGIVTGHGGEMVVPGMASIHTSLVLGR